MNYRQNNGYSPKINSPEFHPRNEGGTSLLAVISLVLSVIAMITFVVLGFFGIFSWSLSLIIGGVLGLFFVVIYFITRKKTTVNHQSAYDAKVVRKKILRKKDAPLDSDSVYLMVFKTEKGEEHKMNLSHHKKLFSYYDTGDDVRFHPGFPYPEKYEKAYDPVVVCVSCGKLTNLEHEKCRDCHLTLLK